MSLKNMFNNLFSYTPESNYQFTISENTNQTSQNTNQQEKIINIFPSLQINIEYIKTRYNLLINRDVILLEFTFNIY